MLPQRLARRRSRWHWSAIAVLLVVVPPLAFYGWFESRSRAVVSERNLDGSFHNALKHASAAAGLYALLRTAGLPKAMAEAGVVELGSLNERAELVFKRGRRDTTAEIMKDLHNNMVGIGVARWMEESRLDQRHDHWTLLVQLGRRGVLKLSSAGMDLMDDRRPSDDRTANFPAAEEWARSRRDGVVRDVGRGLAEITLTGVW